ncbi:MAG: hypothetical protein ACI9J3_001090 [Parvicellaceae bacterium]|jgi:hypothetical protein
MKRHFSLLIALVLIGSASQVVAQSSTPKKPASIAPSTKVTPTVKNSQPILQTTLGDKTLFITTLKEAITKNKDGSKTFKFKVDGIDNAKELVEFVDYLKNAEGMSSVEMNLIKDQTYSGSINLASMMTRERLQNYFKRCGVSEIVTSKETIKL